MPISGIAPVTIQFTDISNGTGTAWFWQFGDGTTSTSQNPSHTYSTPGVYTVTLWITTANGVAQHSDTVTVGSTTSSGVVSAWALEESSGTRYDSIGSTDLTDYGSVLSIAGVTAKGADFTIASAQSLYAPVPTLDFTQGVSVTGWVYLPTLAPDGEYRYLVSIGTAYWGGGLFQLFTFDSGAHLQAIVGSATNGDAESVLVAAARDAWHFFAMIYHPATKKVGLTVDGAAESLSAAIVADPVLDAQNYIALGSDAEYTGPLRFSTCRIDEVALWNRELTTSEVTELYNRRSIPPASVTATAWTPSARGMGTPGEDPQVMLRISNDGGKTFISEQWRSAGKAGEYLARVEWNRLGAARRRVFEVVVTDPIPWRLTGAYLKLREGAR
jgi:PKD repeat protein